jgi:putative acetyltransferase
MQVETRRALPRDAEDIVGVHFAAVRQIAAKSYPAEVIEAWSPEPDENRYAQIRQILAAGEELFVVAEVDGKVLGFGAIVPANKELRALYVHPDVAGQGVGAAILTHLELLALEHGIERLSVDASVNAETFYQKHGYHVMNRGTHRLASGVEMDCVKMNKQLRPQSQ